MCVVGGVGWHRRENNKSMQKPNDFEILGNKLEDLVWSGSKHSSLYGFLFLHSQYLQNISRGPGEFHFLIVFSPTTTYHPTFPLLPVLLLSPFHPSMSQLSTLKWRHSSEMIRLERSALKMKIPWKVMRIPYLYDLSLIQRPSLAKSLRTLEWPTSSSFPVLLAHVHSLQGLLIHPIWGYEVLMGRPFRDYTEITKIHGQEESLYTFSEPKLMCSLLSDFRRWRKTAVEKQRDKFWRIGICI